MLRFPSWSVRSKLIAAVVMPSLVTVVVTTSYLSHRYAVYGRQQLGSHGVELAQILAAQAAPAIEFDRADELEPLLRGLLPSKDVVYAAFQDNQGTAWVEHGSLSGRSANIHAIADEENPSSAMSPQGARGSAPSLHELEDLLVVKQGILNRDGVGVGRVVLALSTERLTREQSRQTAVVILFGLCLLGLGFATALYVHFGIARPLAELTEGARIMATGDLRPRPVKEGRNDEINALARAFAEMRDGLRTLQERLVLARKAAESSNVAKSQFLANMSHEIRTPMNGVLGMTQLLLETELTSKQKRYVEVIARSGDALLKLIDSILDLSKIEAEKLDLEETGFSLRALIDDVIGLFEGETNTRELGLSVRVQSDVPDALVGDPVRIRQILTNLVNNAVKFTPNGGVTLRVTRASKSGPIHTLRFEIEDTGRGIPAQVQERLFQPFAQADSSTTRQYGGTGLGLAISRKLVELMGGAIGVMSSVGKGSTFWFTLRLREADASESSISADLCELEGKLAMVVDDEQVNLNLIEGQLEALGMKVKAFQDPVTALRALKEVGAIRPSVVLIDQHMPDLDGLTLARLIKLEPALSDLRLILLSSDVVRGDGREARTVGFSAYLDRPFTKELLVRSLHAVLSGDAKAWVTRHVLETHARPASARILIVDDDPINQEVTAGFLDAFGYSANIAQSGPEAIEAVTRDAFDLILMDWQMPTMDGLEATRRIRELEPKGHRTPIVALTAHAMPSHRSECLAAGMDDYLPKPVAADALRAVLDRWLTAPRRSAPDASSGLTSRAQAPTTPTSPSFGLLTPRTAEAPAVDVHVLERLDAIRSPSGGSMLERLVGLFLDATSECMEDVKSAASRGDSDAIAQVCHRLKSNAGTLGATRLARLFSDLEALGKSKELSVITDCLPVLEREIRLVRDVLEEERNRRSAGRIADGLLDRPTGDTKIGTGIG